MRIRRNASKILGSASLAYAANPSCPSTPASAAVAEAEDFTVCELNCSPWDLMATDPNSSLCSFLTNLEGEEGEEDEGILGNTVKNEETDICVVSAIARVSATTLPLKSPEVFPTNQLQYIILILHKYSTAGELTLKEMKEIEGKRMTKRKRISKGKGKNTVKTSDSSIVAQYCKKSDGKGWHCKRPAQLPNSLCSYHLTQIRAYTANHRATDSSTAITDSGKLCDSNRHKKAVVHEEEATGTDSSFYYYYEGFGPSRGKQRGKISTGGSNSSNVLNACDGKVKVKKEDSSGKESSTILDNGGDDDDNDNNAIAGDDEYDLDCFDEDDEDVNYSTRKEHAEIDVGKIKEKEVEKKRVVKKRGRKPFKCRSLKSLL